MMSSVRIISRLFFVIVCAASMAAGPVAAGSILPQEDSDIQQIQPQDPPVQEKQQETAQQRLPRALAADAAVSTGTLSNGITYYIVTNTTQSGLAEFALIRRHTPSEYSGTIGNIADATGKSSPTNQPAAQGKSIVTGGKAENARYREIQLARASITEIPRFGGKSARSFIAEEGGYAARTPALELTGIASVAENATVYRFGALPVSGRDTVVDSMILMIFNVLESIQTSEYLPQDYSTSDNAIIISGDIKKADILEKLNSFSMIVPQMTPEERGTRQYKWQPTDTLTCTVEIAPSAKNALLSVSYSSPRTPEELMGTSLPVVSEQLGDILSAVIRKRLILKMKENDVPLAAAGCNYHKSSDRPGDEIYEISVRTAPAHIEKTCGIIASIISDIDRYGVLPKEYSDARNEYLTGLFNLSLQTVIPNDTYVKRCISAFLYGATPISDTDRCSLLTRSGSDTTRTRHFNNFAKELLDSTRNLTIRLQTPVGNVTPERLKSIYSAAWHPAEDRGVQVLRAVNQRDTVGFDKKMRKVKANYTREETITGGTFWGFSNGMKVIYKRMDTDGMFYYNLLIRGGYSSVEGFEHGEGAFLNDVLRTCDVGGINSEGFRYLMLTNGITMDSEVRMDDMSVYGTAKRTSLSLLMKFLVALAGDSSHDTEWFEYYRNCELMRLESKEGELDARKAVIDSLFCPEYRYSSDKSVSALHPDLGERAMAFFDEQFSRVNDGVLVIIGDSNEDVMKKFLSKYLGGFETSGKIANRKRLGYQPISGSVTYIDEGEGVSVDVLMSAQIPFTSDSYMTAKVAAVAVQDILNRELCSCGAVAEVEANYMSYPQERVLLSVNVEPLNPESLPEDEDSVGGIGLLFRVREALLGAKVDKDRLTWYKALVKSEIDSRQNDPWYWIEMAKSRISDVKDLNTNYSDKINSVTAGQVTEMISALASGSRVEYLVR